MFDEVNFTSNSKDAIDHTTRTTGGGAASFAAIDC
jgi:hypothetical protein